MSIPEVNKEMEDRKNWVDISEAFTPAGYKKLRTGEVVIFRQPDGSKHYYKIMRKMKGKLLAKRTELFTNKQIKDMGEDEYKIRRLYG